MSTKLCRFCKANYAAALSFGGTNPAVILVIVVSHLNHTCIRCLHILSLAAYFILHRSGQGQHLEEARSEARTPQAPRRAESASRASACALVSVGRFLRRQRSDPSQVRDAAPRPRRWGHEGRSSSVVWHVSADLLSSRGGVLPRRIAWPGAKAARPERRAQAQPRSNGVRRATNGRQRTDLCSSPGRAARDRARSLSSSPQHRTRNSAQKKP
ncbi:hypothetical protein QFZ91_005295 [Paraburkholderia sp. JPY419]